MAKWKTRTSDLMSIFSSDANQATDEDMESARKLQTISEGELLQNGDDNVCQMNGHDEVVPVNRITFRINSKHGGLRLGDSPKENYFAGRRDVLSPEHLEEKSIISPKGTIRGYKNRVRAGIATFLDQPDSEKNKKNYQQIEKGKIVVYTTSMRIIRHTYERCKKVKDMLNTHMVRYEERDVFVNRLYQMELHERLASDQVEIPQTFLDGILLGDAHKLMELNETGKLRKLLQNVMHINVKSTCDKCGGYRFIPCLICHGSKKSLHRNDFTADFVALRCMKCDDNGLARCDLCLDQQE